MSLHLRGFGTAVPEHAMSQSDAAEVSASFAATDSEQVQLLERLAGSVKRFGNRLETRHVAALVQLVETSAGPTAEAAGEVHGALNIPATDAIELIPGVGSDG